MTHCPHCLKLLSELSSDKPISESSKIRFLSRIEKVENGCWIFKGGSDKYGRMRAGGRATLAHIISYKIHKGEIPAGHVVMHNCPSGDNPRCVNPDHLGTGTQSDNMRDAVRKGRNNPPVGVRNGVSKLSPDKVAYIRESIHSGTETLVSLTQKYGLTFQCVYKAALGETWASVGGPLIKIKNGRNRIPDSVISQIRSTPWYRGITVDMAKKFGIDQSHVSNIIRGHSRKPIQPTPK